MEKLTRLAALCKGEVKLLCNPHLGNGEQSMAAFFDDLPDEMRPTPERLAEMEAAGILWEVQFYPATSSGWFGPVWLYDSNLDRLFDRALATFEQRP